MPKKRFQPEEIIGRFRHADVLIGRRKRIADVVKALGVTEVTCYRRWQKFGRTSEAWTWSIKQIAYPASGDVVLQQY